MKEQYTQYPNQNLNEFPFYLKELAANFAIEMMNEIGDQKAARILNIERTDFYRLVCKDYKVSREIYTQVLKAYNDYQRQKRSLSHVNFN